MTTFQSVRGGIDASGQTQRAKHDTHAMPQGTRPVPATHSVPAVLPDALPSTAALGHDFARVRVEALPSGAMIQRHPEDEGVGGNAPSEYMEQGVESAGADRVVEGPYVEPYDPATLAAMEAVAGDVAGMIAFPAKVGWDAARMAGYGLTGQGALARGAAVDVVSDVVTKNPLVGAGALGYDVGTLLARGAGAPADMTPTSGEAAGAAMDALAEAVSGDDPALPPGTSGRPPTEMPFEAYPGPVCEQAEEY